MNKIHLSSALSSGELKERMQKSDTVQEYRRWQALYLISEFHYQAKEVAMIVAVSVHTINKLVYNYNHNGESAIYSQKRGGRRTAILSWEEEEKLLNDLTGGARGGPVVIVKALKQELEKKLDRRLSKDYTYDLLHRHGWRKVSPRPRHPKRNKEVQELIFPRCKYL